MMIKKIIVSSTLFGLVYGFISNYGMLVGENNWTPMDRCMISEMSTGYALIMAILVVALYLIFSYIKKLVSEKMNLEI